MDLLSEEELIINRAIILKEFCHDLKVYIGCTHKNGRTYEYPKDIENMPDLVDFERSMFYIHIEKIKKYVEEKYKQTGIS